MKTRPTIKQKFSFLFVLTIILMLSGCKNSSEPGTPGIAPAKNDTVSNIDPVKILPDQFKILLENGKHYVENIGKYYSDNCIYRNKIIA